MTLGVGLAVLFCAFTVGRITLAEHHRSAAADLLDQNPGEALRRSEDALELEGDSLDSLYVRAAALARLNFYRGARATLLEAAALEPHNHLPWVLLGDLASRRGDAARARRDYAHASELNPRDEELRELSEEPS